MEDWIHQNKNLDDKNSDAVVILLVLDTLNTHTFGLLYHTFHPEEALLILKPSEGKSHLES
ncbi:MAG: hypothetical protein JEY71_05630 [Sphaerochaeta sp.]|nr:hypothetical protein [Sphaerochaeta sp.]